MFQASQLPPISDMTLDHVTSYLKYPQGNLELDSCDELCLTWVTSGPGGLMLYLMTWLLIRDASTFMLSDDLSDFSLEWTFSGLEICNESLTT